VVVATCRFATPASIIAMKLQSAPRRRAGQSYKAAADYFDIFRLLSHPGLLRPLVEALKLAPHGLGEWAARELQARFIVDAAAGPAVLADGTKDGGGTIEPGLGVGSPRRADALGPVFGR